MKLNCAHGIRREKTMRDEFYNLDFDAIYPTPTSEQLCIAFFNRLYRRLHVDNFSLLITFYGLHRNGKSLAAVSFANVLDETFLPNLETRVVYSSKDLLAAFQDIRDRDIKGAAVIVDEAGTGDLSSQRWYESISKIVSAEIQAVGYLNPFIGFVTQSFSFINTTARRLSQGVFEVKRTNKDYANVKPFWVDQSPWTGTYHKYPIFCQEHSGVISNIFKVCNIRMPLPPEDIFKRYEIHSQKYKDRLLRDSIEEVALIQSDKDIKKVEAETLDAIVNEVADKFDEYSTISRQHGLKSFLNYDLIRHKHPEISVKDARLVKALVEKRVLDSKT